RSRPRCGGSKGACPLRPKTAEPGGKEESGTRPRVPRDLQAVRPLHATPRHPPPKRLTCLGDKRSPVQIRAPRSEKSPANARLLANKLYRGRAGKDRRKRLMRIRTPNETAVPQATRDWRADVDPSRDVRRCCPRRGDRC